MKGTRLIPLGVFRVRKDNGRGWPHDSFQSAEVEAAKLAALTPGSTFIVMQDVARVRCFHHEAINDEGDASSAHS